MAAQPAVLTAEGNIKTGLGIFVAGFKCVRTLQLLADNPHVLYFDSFHCYVLFFASERGKWVGVGRVESCQCHSTGSST